MSRTAMEVLGMIITGDYGVLTIARVEDLSNYLIKLGELGYQLDIEMGSQQIDADVPISAESEELLNEVLELREMFIVVLDDEPD